MPEIYPVKSVKIEGAIAKATFHGPERAEFETRKLGPIDVTPEFRSVKNAEEADKEIGNPGDQHHCPLCNEYFGWEAFKAHAPQCIEARAPRNKIWVNAPGALAVFPEKIVLEGSSGI